MKINTELEALLERAPERPWRDDAQNVFDPAGNLIAIAMDPTNGQNPDIARLIAIAVNHFERLMVIAESASKIRATAASVANSHEAAKVLAEIEAAVKETP